MLVATKPLSSTIWFSTNWQHCISCNQSSDHVTFSLGRNVNILCMYVCVCVYVRTSYIKIFTFHSSEKVTWPLPRFVVLHAPICSYYKEFLQREMSYGWIILEHVGTNCLRRFRIIILYLYNKITINKNLCDNNFEIIYFLHKSAIIFYII